MKARTDLTALVGSRICHDLVSPLGAIGNGVELLGLTGIAPSPEMALIVESVENANARLRFFRIAYGAAGTDQRLP
jgi:histidine phosphotransferase ChpT